MYRYMCNVYTYIVQIALYIYKEYKNKQAGLHQTKKLLLSKGNQQ